MATRDLPPPHIPLIKAGTPQIASPWWDYWKAIDQFLKTLGIGAEATICLEFHGGGFVLSPGQQVWIRVPFDCEILSWTATCQPSGSVVVDIWRNVYGSFPPVNADSITASAPVTVSSAVKATNDTLTGWSKEITAFDYLKANIDSVTSVQDLLIELQVKKT